MTIFTREAIKTSFFRIAETRPIDKITVKDIVEDCGINRNSFYYHFEDLPCLIRVSVEEELQRLVLDQAENLSLEQVLDVIADFALEHKNACINIYHSKHRDLLERNFLHVCEKAVSDYFSRTLFEKYPLSREDRQIIVYFYKTLFYGILSDWVNDSLRYDIKARFHRMIGLRNTSAEDMCRHALNLPDKKIKTS